MSRALLEKACDQCGGTFHKDPRYSHRYWGRQRFCSSACYGRYHASRAVIKHLPIREAFDRWVEKTDGCWHWVGSRDRDGYGVFMFNGQSHRAPRIALMLDGRAPSSGQYACHHCDNPSCVRPSHLYPGTPTQNVDDARRRNRMAVGSRRSRLSDDDVMEIRATNETHRAVAERYGVSPPLISMIRRRKIWRHLP